MQIVKKWYFIVIFALIVILIGTYLRLPRAETDSLRHVGNPFANLTAKPKNGSPVPDFELSTVNGKKIAIGQYAGKPVVVNFWATWCDPCILEMPLLQTAVDRHPDDLVVLAVNIEEPVNTVDAFGKKFHFTFPILLDVDGKVAHKFGVFAYPASFFIDKEGIIRSQQIGQMDEAMLQKNLETIGIKTW